MNPMQPTKKKSNSTFYMLIFVAAILYIPFLGNVHLFDWDEINFAEISREMVASGKYSQPQINFELFTEKPPLYFWLQSACMNLFGINEFSARLPNALLGLLVLPILYSLGKKLRDHTFGLLWAFFYACSILPHLYFKSGIIDPWFNIFIFLSLYFMIVAVEKRKETKQNFKWLITGGFFCGMAVLTKGPVALILIGLTFFIYWAFNRFRWVLSIPQLLLFIFACICTAGIWLGVDYVQHGDQFLKEFTIRQWELLTKPDAGHGGFLFYHFVVLFFGCFPATAFFLQSLVKKDITRENAYDFKRWMIILFWVVIIVFSLVQTKIVHYSSLCYYPISFLAALSAHNIIHKKWLINRWMKAVTIITGLPFVIAPFVAAYLGKNISQLKPLLSKDPFATENLQAKVVWSGWEFIPGLLLAFALIASIYFFNRQKHQRAVWILLGGAAMFTQLTLFFLIGRIEAISQRASIEFWEAHKEEDCYFTSYGYKTYTYFFYGRVKPAPKAFKEQSQLIKGIIDKPVYISCKVTQKDELEKELTDAVFLYNKNGFYFYKRLPQAR
jgi:4-amino-4-deoxy-L-arabinose transferase-like glycosyltransferase